MNGVYPLNRAYVITKGRAGIHAPRSTTHEREEEKGEMVGRRFKEAILLRGMKSNKLIAEMVGTKTTRQVSSYKSRFLRKNPIWATFSDPPSVSTTTDTSGANSPPSAQSVDLGSPSASSQESQQQGGTAGAEGPSQDVPSHPPCPLP